MKSKFYQYFLLFFAFVTLSCSNDNKTNTNSTTPSETIEYTYQGNFVASSHPTSGVAKISKDKTQLLLESFKTDNGPDLNIYLASNLSTIKTDHIDLGDIKGLNGNYSYSTTTTIDYSKYKYVVVWCVAFNANFGYAVLAP
jgi:hypothetical protein